MVECLALKYDEDKCVERLKQCEATRSSYLIVSFFNCNTNFSSILQKSWTSRRIVRRIRGN